MWFTYIEEETAQFNDFAACLIVALICDPVTLKLESAMRLYLPVTS